MSNTPSTDEGNLFAEKLAKRKINNNSPELQERLMDWVDKFVEMVPHFLPNGQRYDYPEYGSLAEMMKKAPARVYDLPELKAHVDTAFVDTTGRFYISDTFFRACEADQLNGSYALFLIFMHEMDHLRRLHFQRMLDLPPEVANWAQDCKINIDAVTTIIGNKFSIREGNMPTKEEFDKAVALFYEQMPKSISIGWALSNVEDYYRWRNMSEEAIGAELLKTYRKKNNNPNHQISFPILCEAVKQDLDAMNRIAVQANPKLKPAPFTALSTLVNAAGVAKGKLPANDIMTLYADLNSAMATQEMTARNLEHDGITVIAQRNGTPVQSVNCGDTVIDAWVPIERFKSLQKILEMILNPANLVNQNQQNTNAVTVKDLELPRSNPNSSPQQNNNQKNPQNSGSGSPSDGNKAKTKSDPQSNQSPDNGNGQSSSPGNDSGSPSSKPGSGSGSTNGAGAGGGGGEDPGADKPNIYEGDSHVMSGAKLGQILHEAGATEAAKALGYDDLKTIKEAEADARTNVMSAINQAAEDLGKIGKRYPGGHSVEYAIQQLNELYKPKFTWEFAMKQITENLGNRARFEHDEPWSQYYTPHEDQGLDSADDVGYMGSYVLGGNKRPLVINVVDSSGSVNDGMLKRFVTESVNMANESLDNETSAEVLLIFADTIARGQPVFITPENVNEYLARGVQGYGRGGTNFTATIQNVFRLVSPHHHHEADNDNYEFLEKIRGRKIEAVIYWTDTGDEPPIREVIEETAFDCGMNQLPTMLFLAPQSCYDDRFIQMTSSYAETIFYPDDPKKDVTINLEEIEQNIEDRGLRNKI